MANRTYNQFQGTLLKGVVTLYAKLTASGGALTVVTQEIINPTTSPVTINPSNGFVSETIAPPSGPYYTYSIKLQDPYVRLLDVHAVLVDPLGSTVPVSCLVVADNVKSQTNPSVDVTFLCTDVTNPTAGVAANKPSDGTILLTVSLSNSTAL